MPLCPGHIEIKVKVQSEVKVGEGVRLGSIPKGCPEEGAERKNPREEPEPRQVAGEGAALRGTGLGREAVVGWGGGEGLGSDSLNGSGACIT